MYIKNIKRGLIVSVQINDKSIPLDPANSDYQKVLDDIIEQGADCFEGDIPEELQAAADAKAATQEEI